MVHEWSVQLPMGFKLHFLGVGFCIEVKRRQVVWWCGGVSLRFSETVSEVRSLTNSDHISMFTYKFRPY